jgi:two-component system chemotaxis response regulator CheY
MSSGRILVVDDDPDIRKSLRLVLSKLGYEVVEGEDGEAAIKTIRSGDNPLKVDAIICDLYMPKVNGQEAIAFFRVQFPSVPVIVLTGQPDVSSASSLYQQGIADYLTKPIDPEKLKQVVAKAVKEGGYKDPFKT